MDLSEAPGHTNLVSANRINSLPSEILMHNKISKIENKKPGYSQQLETTHAEDLLQTPIATLLHLLAQKEGTIQ